MRIKLGATARTDAPSPGLLGSDARSRLTEALLANVKEPSRFSFDQNATSLGETDLLQLQRLVGHGPDAHEMSAEYENQMLPFAGDCEPELPLELVDLNLSFAAQPASDLPQQAEDQPPSFTSSPEAELFIQPAQYVDTPAVGFNSALYNRPAQVGRTVRGTIEFVLQEDGRKLVPEYNKCGILTGVDFGQGTKIVQESDGSWCVNSASNRQALPVNSIAFDRNGCLSISTSCFR